MKKEKLNNDVIIEMLNNNLSLADICNYIQLHYKNFDQYCLSKYIAALSVYFNFENMQLNKDKLIKIINTIEYYL